MADQSSCFLEAADFIGAKLCRDAIWSGLRCNWFGIPVGYTQRSHVVEAQSICGPDFYSGTSGIAVFLARLFAATGEKIFRMTAEGAIRQALSRLDHFPSDKRIDFYEGLTGVAYGLFEMADGCAIEKFNEMGLLIMQDLASDSSPNRCSNAATITALLRMHQRHRADFLLQLATRCGEELQDRTTVDVVTAMLDLFHTTGEKEYRNPVEAILQNDRNDSSETTAEHLRTGRGYIRAFEALHDDSYAIRAREAIEVLRTRIDCLTGDVDFSFPSGLAATGDLLLEGSRILGDDDLRRTAERVGNWGIERHKQDDLPWPCGSTSGWDSPSFMHGVAGIGYFYLRLHDPSHAPSINI